VIDAVTVLVAEHISTDEFRSELADCWRKVANDGGAVGFPFLPVSVSEVQRAVVVLADEVQRDDVTLLHARVEGKLAGWVTLRYNRFALTAHWASVERLQSHPNFRGTGVGAALLRGAVDQGQKRGLDHLRLALRGGEGLEPFYEKYGWHEIGRHKNALRLAAGDDRDEVFMTLTDFTKI
jgi:GNAT superfamily N-acetyltransferase